MPKAHIILFSLCPHIEVTAVSSYKEDNQTAVRGIYDSVVTAVSIFLEKQISISVDMYIH
jgi:hypothetical protein